MTLYNNGTIVLKNNLVSSNLIKAKNMFNASYQVIIHPYDVDGEDFADIEIENLTGDLTCELRDLCDFCKASGMTIVDGDIRYYGDYEGSYRYNSELAQFEEHDALETAILDASDVQLMGELKRRGYEIMKKSGSLTSGYAAVTFENV